MKFSIEIDATPQEVRETLGLPDIQAVQERMIERIEERVMASVDEYDPAKLLTMFVPEGVRFLMDCRKLSLMAFHHWLEKVRKKIEGSSFFVLEHF